MMMAGDIVLPDDKTQVISPSVYPYLNEHVGNDIITASGLTLLGADDKAGVAIIMDFANYLVSHPEIKHGTIKYYLRRMRKLAKALQRLILPNSAPTMPIRSMVANAALFEDETFSADGVKITVHGVIAHPGYAKISS